MGIGYRVLHKTKPDLLQPNKKRCLRLGKILRLEYFTGQRQHNSDLEYFI
jgi:hypothetical protein